MASITSDTRNRYYSTLNVWETSYSIEGNYSDTYYELILYVGSNSFSGYTIGHRVKINNEEVAYHDNNGNQTSMSANTSKIVASGTKRIYHNADGTKNGISISFEIWTNNLSYLPVYLSASGSFDLTHIPRQATLTGANDFNSDGNPYMTFSNPGGLVIDCYLEFGGTNIMRENVPNTGNYMFKLTDEEKRLLLSKCPNSNSLSVRYVIQTKVNGVATWWSYLDKTMYVIDSNPTFKECLFEDIGTISTGLTGDNQIFIKEFNTLQVTIPEALKAIANNYATMSKYRLVCGNQSIEAEYSSDNDVVLLLQNVANTNFILYAIDSRGNSTKIEKAFATWKDYSEIKVKNGSAERTGGVGKETILTFEGTIWNNSFGAESNKIVSCQYKYKKSNESGYGEAIDITPTISDNTFNFNSIIKGDAEAEGFNVSNSFNIQVIVTDKLKTTTYDILLGAGTPAMAIHREGVGFGAPYNPEEGGSLQVDGKNILKLATETVKWLGYYKGSCNDVLETGICYVSGGTDCPSELNGTNYGFLFTKYITDNYMVQTFEDVNSNRSWKRTKTGGTWGSWERQLILKDVKWLSSPLTTTNTSVYDFDISKAKAVIVYFSFSGENYRDSVVIPYQDTQWYQVNFYDGSVGFLNVNWVGGLIGVSTYSASTFKIFGYSLIM